MTLERMKCVAGCKVFTGDEIQHHKDCPYYPESRSKMYDDLLATVEESEKLQIESTKIMHVLDNKIISLTDRLTAEQEKYKEAEKQWMLQWQEEGEAYKAGYDDGLKENANK